MAATPRPLEGYGKEIQFATISAGVDANGNPISVAAVADITKQALRVTVVDQLFGAIDVVADDVQDRQSRRFLELILAELRSINLNIMALREPYGVDAQDFSLERY